MSGEGGQTPEELTTAPTDDSAPAEGPSTRIPKRSLNPLKWIPQRFFSQPDGGRRFQQMVDAQKGSGATAKPHDPALGLANRLDQAARSMDVPQGMGGIKTTMPTAEGLARAQDAAASTSPSTPTSNPTQRK